MGIQNKLKCGIQNKWKCVTQNKYVAFITFECVATLPKTLFSIAENIVSYSALC